MATAVIPTDPTAHMVTAIRTTATIMARPSQSDLAIRILRTAIIRTITTAPTRTTTTTAPIITMSPVMLTGMGRS
jgi:hypothetical protein